MTAARQGFTLIELVLALVVTSLVVAGMQRAISVTTDSRDRAIEAAREITRTAGARELLTTWLRGAVPPAGGVPFLEFASPEGDSESVAFWVADGGDLYPGPRIVRLWIERDATAAGGLGLMAEVSGRVDEVGAPDTLVLEPSAERLVLRYWGAHQGLDQWVDEWQNPDVLPKVVELTLGTTPRVRVGPNGSTTFDLPPLMRMPITVPLSLGAW